MTHSHPYTATITKQKGSMAEIAVEIPFASVDEHRAAAVKSLARDLEMPGFRKGHIPEKILVQHFGEMAILGEAAEIVVRHTYPHIIEDHALDVIGAPNITITKIAPANPLSFKIEVTLVPEVTLPDYMAIAKEKNAGKSNIAVTDKELDETIEQLLRQKAAYDRIQEKARIKAEGLTLPTPETDDELTALPELTDEYVRSLGDFSSVEDFKKKLRERVEAEKKQEAESKHRATITDALVDESRIDLPKMLVEAELQQMLGQMEADLKQANLTIESYLQHVKKSREDLEKEFSPAAEKRAKLQLIFNAIAREEKLAPNTERLERETNELALQFKDADRERLRLYVASVLQNEAVLKLLEEAH